MDYRAYARQQAIEAGLDPDIFERQIDAESGFNPNVVSPAGAIGIAQIVPRWHPDVDPWDPYASLAYAARLMRSYLDRYGSYALALAAYNAGPGAVDEYGGMPPYDETQRYVRSILSDGAAMVSAPAATGGQTGSGAGVLLVVAAAVILLLLR